MAYGAGHSVGEGGLPFAVRDAEDDISDEEHSQRHRGYGGAYLHDADEALPREPVRRQERQAHLCDV